LRFSPNIPSPSSTFGVTGPWSYRAKQFKRRQEIGKYVRLGGGERKELENRYVRLDLGGGGEFKRSKCIWVGNGEGKEVQTKQKLGLGLSMGKKCQRVLTSLVNIGMKK
jgi:hypothetical protein